MTEFEQWCREAEERDGLGVWDGFGLPWSRLFVTRLVVAHLNNDDFETPGWRRDADQAVADLRRIGEAAGDLGHAVRWWAQVRPDTAAAVFEQYLYMCRLEADRPAA